MRWFSKETEHTSVFRWTHCRHCNAIECKMPDALITINSVESPIPPHDISGWTWGIHIEEGYPKDLIITSVGTFFSEDQAKFAAKEAYCRWMGLI